MSNKRLQQFPCSRYRLLQLEKKIRRFSNQTASNHLPYELLPTIPSSSQSTTQFSGLPLGDFKSPITQEKLVNDRKLFQEVLTEWAVTCKVPLVTVSKLLHILRSFMPELPRHAGTLLQHPRHTILRKVPRSSSAQKTKKTPAFDVESIAKAFKECFGQVLSILYGNSSEELRFANSYLQRIATYNSQNGKQIRGKLVVTSFLSFGGDPTNFSLYKTVLMVGWCVELLHAGFLILDDIMDNSVQRRGQPSWFIVQKQSGMGFASINDGLHLILAAKHLLHCIFFNPAINFETFSNKDMCSLDLAAYLKLVKLFDQITYNTCYGQTLDLLTSNPKFSQSSFIANYSSNIHENVTQWKTGYYTFYLPVACGMILAQVNDEKVFDCTKEIMLQFGRYFQDQDDFLDCFGDVNVTGKIGTDIADGKCSWLIVEALKRATDEQKQILEQNYGKSDCESQKLVYSIYESLSLPELFTKHEVEMQNQISQLITNSKSVLCNYPNCENLFSFLMQLLFHRNH